MNLVTALRTLSTTKIGKFTTKNAPRILIGFGVVSSMGTVASTVIATKRSLDILEAEKLKRIENLKKSQGENSEKTIVKIPKPEEIKIAPKEVVQLCWKEWMVPTGLFIGSTASFICGFRLEETRALTALTLLGGAESRLAAIESEMLEKLGDKKAKEVQQAVSEKIIKEEKIGTPETTATVTSKERGGYTCYDPITHQEWKVEGVNDLKWGRVEAGRILDKFGQITLGELLESLGGKVPEGDIADKLLWRKRMYEDADEFRQGDDVFVMDIEDIVDWDAILNTREEPVYCLRYNKEPHWDSEGLPFR